jgi:hypothetical protein
MSECNSARRWRMRRACSGSAPHSEQPTHKTKTNRGFFTWVPVPVGEELQAGVHGANVHARVKMLLRFRDLGRGVYAHHVVADLGYWGCFELPAQRS